MKLYPFFLNTGIEYVINDIPIRFSDYAFSKYASIPEMHHKIFETQLRRRAYFHHVFAEYYDMHKILSHLELGYINMEDFFIRYFKMDIKGLKIENIQNSLTIERVRFVPNDKMFTESCKLIDPNHYYECSQRILNAGFLYIKTIGIEEKLKYCILDPSLIETPVSIYPINYNIELPVTSIKPFNLEDL